MPWLTSWMPCWIEQDLPVALQGLSYPLPLAQHGKGPATLGTGPGLVGLEHLPQQSPSLLLQAQPLALWGSPAEGPGGLVRT